MKRHLKRFAITLLPKYRLIYVALTLCVWILIFEDQLYLILAMPFGFMIWKKHSDLAGIIGIVLVLYSLSRLSFELQIPKPTGQLTAKVLDVNCKDSYCQISVLYKFKKVNIGLSDGENILIGSTYHFYGQFEPLESETIPNGFNYRNYLYSKNVVGQFKASSYEYDHGGVALGTIAKNVESYIDTNLPKSKGYVKTFILADKGDIDHTVLESINMLGISHMFAVSGYHVGVLVIAIKKGLSKLPLKPIATDVILIGILVFYMIITGFAASVVRASMLFIGLMINRQKNFGFSTLDILVVIFILLLLVRPFYHYNIGFVLSFYVTLVLILSRNILKDKTATQTIVLVSFIAFLSSFPIVINLNHQINLLTIIYNIMIIYIMTVILLPLIYITTIIPILDTLTSVVYKTFEQFLEVLERVDIFVIDGFIEHSWQFMIMMIIIYIIFVLIERKRSVYRWILTLICFVGIILNGPLFRFSQDVVFLDVYGDSTVILDSFDRCNVLIDTGEVDSYDSVIGYLRSRNIRRIDLFILSHFHSDHVGEADDILSEFDVKHVISKHNVTMYENDEFACGSLQIHFYPLSYDALNENNNSIVFTIEVSERTYLFVGDSEWDREQEIIRLLDREIDYLKVGHHGSITSSAEEFLDAITPKEAFIIVSRDNRHGHPHDVVIARYEERNILVHRTDECGSIEVRYLFGKERKKYHRP